MHQTRKQILRITVGVLLVGATGAFLSGGLASAGGANWTFDKDGYRPGDTVDARTGIGWEGREGMAPLGAPGDGPYSAYLVDTATSNGQSHDPRHEPGAVGVGTIAIQEEPIEEKPGFFVGPHGAILRFVLPDIPPGHYWLEHCNEPCTTHLADISYGQLTVLNPDGTTPPTNAPVRTADSPTSAQLLRLPTTLKTDSGAPASGERPEGGNSLTTELASITHHPLASTESGVPITALAVIGLVGLATGLASLAALRTRRRRELQST